MILQNNKIFLVSSSIEEKLAVVKELKKLDDSILTAFNFSTDPIYQNKPENYVQYKSYDSLELDFQNNALLCVKTNENQISEGITIDAYYTYDIFLMDYSLYNNIPDILCNNKNNTVIWIDAPLKKTDPNYSSELRESKYFIDRIGNLQYMYFFGDDSKYIASTIIEYINSDESKKEMIRYENN